MDLKLFLFALLFLSIACEKTQGESTKIDFVPQDSLAVKEAVPEEPLPPKEYRIVNALSGLNYRDKPKGKILGNFPYYSRLEYVGKSGISQVVKDEGKRITGEWVAVMKDQDTVFVFDGFLLPDFKREENVKPQYTGMYAMRAYLRKGFVSLTDAFAYNDHPDSLSIDPAYLGNVDFEEYHVMKKLYRDRFLERSKIRETDTVYVYHFSKDQLFKFPVHSLPLLAHLTIYGSYKPIPQWDYLIGFWFEDQDWEDKVLYGNTFAAIGNHNPFVRKGLVPIIWEEMDSTRFPRTELSEWGKKRIKPGDESKTFTFQHKGLTYYLKSYGYKAQQMVVKTKAGETLYSNTLLTSEGSSFAPFAFKGKEMQDDYLQWTGELVKDKGPVMFGFEYMSFGCPGIIVLDGKNGAMGIACDNRH